jgi:hypothetical protein
MEAPVTETKSLLPRHDRWLPEEKIGNSRVAHFSEELGLAICERISKGETLRHICKDPGYPSPTTVHRWVLLHQDFATAYKMAREMSSYSLEDEALDNARLIRAIPGDSSRVRAFDIAINQLRWSAGRRNPSVYSDRASVNITVPIQINTSLDLDAGPVKSLPGDTSDPNSVFTIEAMLPTEEPIDAQIIPEPEKPEGPYSAPAPEPPATDAASKPRRGRPPGSTSKRQLKPRKPPALR